MIAGAGQLSQVSLVSGTIHITATIYQQERGVVRNEMLTFRSSPDAKWLMTLKSQGFEKPALFLYHGEPFVHVSTTPSGSGAFVTDTVFWIAPDATMHEIDFQDAAEAYEDKVDGEEVVLTGGSGVNCAGGNLNFEFYIADMGDPHCCPTAGKVTGNYTIIGTKQFDPGTKQYSSTFKMVAIQYLRTPILAGQLAVASAR